MIFDGGQVRRQHRDALAPGAKVRQPVGEARADPAGFLHGIGKLRRMRRGQHHHGNGGIAVFFFCDSHRDGRMGIDQIAGLAPGGADCRRGCLLR